LGVGKAKNIDELFSTYGLVLASSKWDEDGNLINEKKDLTEGEKRIFDRFEELEAGNHGK